MESKTSMIMIKTLILTTLLLGLSSSAKTHEQIRSSRIELTFKQSPNSAPQKFIVNHTSLVKSKMQLSQQSKIQILAKIKFDSQDFYPQLFSFRLTHPQYDKLSQPVQAVYDSEQSGWKCLIDLGDPKVILPYSDLYILELIIADDKLKTNVKNNIANVKISFRYSMEQANIPDNNSPIAYKTQSIIQTNAPETRVDPPATFTFFVCIVMLAFTLIFLYGYFVHLKVNFRLLPSDGIGLILNLSLIGLLGLNLLFLLQFWLQWNFITTVGNFFWLTIATALLGNYALLYIKNKP